MSNTVNGNINDFFDFSYQRLKAVKWLFNADELMCAWEKTILDMQKKKVIFIVTDSNHQVFGQPVSFGSFSTLLVFNVFTLYSLAQKQLAIQKVPLSEFSLPEKSITPKYIYQREPEKSDTKLPIIVAPLPLNPLIKGVVVDGNHRVTRAVRKETKIISVYFCDEKMATISLSTPFQRALYMMVLEIQEIETLSISSPSYYNSKKIKYLIQQAQDWN